jgi:hypothetical protein
VDTDEATFQRIAARVASAHGVYEKSSSIRFLLDKIDEGYSLVSSAAAQGLISPEAERHLRECILSAYEVAAWALHPLERTVGQAVSTLARPGSSPPSPPSKPST